jgi:hypothetical protein
MYFSINNLKNNVEKFNEKLKKNKGKNGRERYGEPSPTDDYNWIADVSDYLSLVFAVLFFTVELLVLFYCLQIAFSCSQKGPERIIHIVLALTFTMPYALINVVFNTCAVNTLRASSNLF